MEKKYKKFGKVPENINKTNISESESLSMNMFSSLNQPSGICYIDTIQDIINYRNDMYNEISYTHVQFKTLKLELICLTFTLEELKEIVENNEEALYEG